ncbi:MAG: VWA domain-containing protein [Synergistaceae bacterium]|jgi:Ca-activated chloride channel family protein|nr:VWA domain-containing protein [Synergistaceae bacterium]
MKKLLEVVFAVVIIALIGCYLMLDAGDGVSAQGKAGAQSQNASQSAVPETLPEKSADISPDIPISSDVESLDVEPQAADEHQAVSEKTPPPAENDRTQEPVKSIFSELRKDAATMQLASPGAVDSFEARTYANDVSGTGYYPMTGDFSISGGFPETAQYESYGENPVKQVSRDPLSTFSLDVNTTSYANTRRFLNEGRLPDPDAVRVEELVNYFPAMDQDMAPRHVEGSPFDVAYELAPCPWNEDNTLLWMTMTAKGVDFSEAPRANLVFLVDVSGSMSPPERLPLVQSALKMLSQQMRPDDMISLVTYAGSTAVALEATPGRERGKITAAIDSLGAGGSTAGAAGLTLAYEQARRAYIKGGVNRILLCTDGDFNVGVSDSETLESMIEREREGGVTLSILGFGTDNYNDAMMTKISNVGNGNYSYVDSMSEARKVLNEEMTSTLVTVAKDVKAQIEFNPANVMEYRQIGYEKRILRDEDFNNDAIDAGDVGAGRRVTILYELTPAGGKPSVDPLRYQASPEPVSRDDFTPTEMKSDEVAWLKFRWKEPDGVKSSMAETPIMKTESAKSFSDAGTGLRFSAAVAAYGQKLRNGSHLSDTTWSQIEAWADASRGSDPYRAEFVQLVKLAGSLSGGNKPAEK